MYMDTMNTETLCNWKIKDDPKLAPNPCLNVDHTQEENFIELCWKAKSNKLLNSICGHSWHDKI